MHFLLILKGPDWDGFNFGSIIFPAFMFIAGYCVPLAFKNHIETKKSKYHGNTPFCLTDAQSTPKINIAICSNDRLWLHDQSYFSEI